MKIYRWQGPGYRITASEDVFFRSPLNELTLFRFTTPYFEVEPHRGEFSIKAVLSGVEHYNFGRRVVTLRPGQLLLVSAGEKYASAISAPTESLSIFFGRNDVFAAARSLTDPEENLIETPWDSVAMPTVAQVAFPATPVLRQCLGDAVSAVDNEAIGVAEEAVRSLLLAALAEAWQIAPRRSLAHIRRTSTRDELVARVLRARELIEDAAGRNVDLDCLANEACLSRYHFLRVFTAVVGETPIAYARRVVLDRAIRAVARGEDPRKTARTAGYMDFRAFTRACRRIADSVPGTTSASCRAADDEAAPQEQ